MIEQQDLFGPGAFPGSVRWKWARRRAQLHRAERQTRLLSLAGPRLPASGPAWDRATAAFFEPREEQGKLWP